ncbi:MAG: CoA-binding protein [Chloroflexi bacterium]|nr:MAG: CoA-binding protein [Chloroflexota bacterium]MBL1194421.1 CoA-binding protein [Chloroflexota bacterium]
MREILKKARVIAVVGHSDKPYRTSYQIAQYLRNVDYKVYPVNPMVQSIAGEKSYASLAEIPEEIDIVDVFRRSEHLQGVVDDAIAVGAKAVWSQLGVVDQQAARTAEEAGLDMVMDLCIKVEHARLLR